MRRFRLSVIFCLFVASLGILAEGIARVWLCHFAPDDAFLYLASVRQYVKHGDNRGRFAPHPYLGMALRSGARDDQAHINSLGFRGEEIAIPKPSREFRIACLGGSTTYDDEIADDSKTYPARLAHHLNARGYNVTVINAGVPGWTSYESLINFAFRVSYLDPDLIILFDAWNDLSVRVVRPESYASDNTGAKNGGLFAFPWYESSTLVRMMLLITGHAQSHVYSVMNKQADTLLLFPHDPVFTKSSLSEILRQNPPIYFKNNLKNIIAMAREKSIQTLLLTFCYSRAPQSVASICGVPPDRTDRIDEVLAAFDEMNAAIRDVAQASGAPIFDLEKAFPQDADFGKHYVDGFHNNETGADLKASLIADFLIDASMIPDEYKVPAP